MTDDTAPNAATVRAADQHALLADPTRRAILRALGLAAGPLDAHQLAASLGLHVNSVREQLRHLDAAGRLILSLAPATGRGRPRVLYALDPRGGRDPHRALVLGLVDHLAASPDGRQIGRAAGARWGEAEALAERVRGHDQPSAVGTLTAMLAAEGFAPDAVPALGPAAATTLRLRACPYLPLAAQQLRVVCAVHLGYLEGSVRALGAPDTVVALAPFGEPDACLATLTPAGDPADA